MTHFSIPLNLLLSPWLPESVGKALLVTCEYQVTGDAVKWAFGSPHLHPCLRSWLPWVAAGLAPGRLGAAPWRLLSSLPQTLEAAEQFHQCLQGSFHQQSTLSPQGAEGPLMSTHTQTHSPSSATLSLPHTTHIAHTHTLTHSHKTPKLMPPLTLGEGNGNPLQHSCWRIPWTEEPGGLQSMGSQGSGMT